MILRDVGAWCHFEDLALIGDLSGSEGLRGIQRRGLIPGWGEGTATSQVAQSDYGVNPMISTGHLPLNLPAVPASPLASHMQPAASLDCLLPDGEPTAPWEKVLLEKGFAGSK